MFVCAPFHSIANAPVGMAYLRSFLQRRGIDCPLEDLNIRARQYLIESQDLDADAAARRRIVDELFALSRRTYMAEALTWSWLSPDGAEGLVNRLRFHPSQTLRDFWLGANIEQILSSPETERAGALLREWLRRQAERLVSEAHGWIGLSTVVTNLAATLFLAQRIRELDKDILIVLGGPHITSRTAGPLLQCFPCLDAAIPAPAFLPLADALEAHFAGRSLTGIPGVWSRESPGGAIHEGGSQRWINLDELPPADWTNLPLNLYESGFMMRNDSGDFSPWYPTIPIQTSRGCSFSRCRFCHNVTDYPKYQMQSPARVAAEVKRQIETTGSRGFFFTDDEFAGSRKRTIEICRSLIELDEDIRFFCWLRLDSFDPELLDIMYRAGARQLFIGCEAVENKLLNQMNKGYDGKVAFQQLVMLDEFWKKHPDFIYTFNLIVDYPGETIESVEETLKIVAKNPHLFFNRVAACCQFHLYEGTPEYCSWKGELVGCLDGVLPPGVRMPSFRYLYPYTSPHREERMEIWSGLAEFIRFKGPRAKDDLTTNTIGIYD